MKLKSDFITQTIDGTQFLVSIGAESFQGIARSNKTWAFIVDCLKEETTHYMVMLCNNSLLCGSGDRT